MIWLKFTEKCHIALFAAVLVGCANHGEARSSAGTPSPPPGLSDIQRRCLGAGNDGVRLWRCSTLSERREMTAGTIWDQEQHFKNIRVLARNASGMPSLVLDIRSGFRGQVVYDGVTVLSSDNTNGWRLVPLQNDNGSWAVLVLKMEGEFDVYRGLRRL